MIIHTFIETPEYNGFAGKTVIPFRTYYSSASTALTDIVAGTPDANHLDGYGTRGASSYNTSAIAEWLQRIGILDVVNGINNVELTQNGETKAVYLPVTRGTTIRIRNLHPAMWICPTMTISLFRLQCGGEQSPCQ